MVKVIIAILVAALGAAGAWYWYDSSDEQQVARPLPPVPPPTSLDSTDEQPDDTGAPKQGGDPYAQWQGSDSDQDAAPAVAVAPPKTVDDSDQRFVAAVADLSRTAAKWFVPEQQIRKWVVTVDLMADGDIPGRNRPLAVKMKRFAANRIGETDVWEMSDDNYSRLTPLVSAFTAIEPESVAAYYKAWLPLFERAYGELGKRGDFASRLKLAIARIQSVKPLKGGVRLKRPGAMYVYADAELEAAPGVSKLMWRLGPENLARIQAYLKRLEPLL